MMCVTRRIKLLIYMVSRLGLEPRALALKGERSSLGKPTRSKNSRSCVLQASIEIGSFWGLSSTVHGHNTDNQAYFRITRMHSHSRLQIVREFHSGCVCRFQFVRKSVCSRRSRREKRLPQGFVFAGICPFDSGFHIDLH